MFPPAFLLLITLAAFLFWCESSNHFSEIGQTIINFLKQFSEDRCKSSTSKKENQIRGSIYKRILYSTSEIQVR